MADLALDSTYCDLLVSDDKIHLVTGDDSIVQKMMIRFRFGLGEWFLDVRLGIPYFEEILIKAPDLSIIRLLFQEVILTTPGISSIVELNLDLNRTTRVMSVSFIANKSDGTTLTLNRKEFLL